MSRPSAVAAHILAERRGVAVEAARDTGRDAEAARCALLDLAPRAATRAVESVARHLRQSGRPMRGTGRWSPCWRCSGRWGWKWREKLSCEGEMQAGKLVSGSWHALLLSKIHNTDALT